MAQATVARRLRFLICVLNLFVVVDKAVIFQQLLDKRKALAIFILLLVIIVLIQQLVVLIIVEVIHALFGKVLHIGNFPLQMVIFAPTTLP